MMTDIECEMQAHHPMLVANVLMVTGVAVLCLSVTVWGIAMVVQLVYKMSPHENTGAH